jgi:hypothetical protein
VVPQFAAYPIQDIEETLTDCSVYGMLTTQA